MRWGLTVGRLFGAHVRVHPLLLVALTWIAFDYWGERRSTTAALGASLLALSIFLSVLAHELGHVIAARWYRTPIPETTLLPFGGIAGAPLTAGSLSKDVMIALAGPMVSLVIAVDLYLSWWFAVKLQWFTGIDLMTGAFFERLLFANIALVVINLLPAMPLDGGQALRALLAARVSHLRATQILAAIGLGCAIALAGMGWFTDPLFVLVAMAMAFGALHALGDARRGRVPQRTTLKPAAGV